MKRIAILASGSGTNAERLTRYFRESGTAEIGCIITNRSRAYVLERAERLGVHTAIFPKEAFRDGKQVLAFLQEMRIDFIVLAGFLLLVPECILRAYPGRVVNIHPALLPRYGGKGMYGERVHEAVIANRDKVSGITIHYVNDKYDEGDIIFQARCDVEDTDTPDSLAEKIHTLEHEHYPVIVENLLRNI